jgi:hypothetical protein
VKKVDGYTLSGGATFRIRKVKSRKLWLLFDFSLFEFEK